jgi:hypothetical protein
MDGHRRRHRWDRDQRKAPHMSGNRGSTSTTRNRTPRPGLRPSLPIFELKREKPPGLTLEVPSDFDPGEFKLDLPALWPTASRNSSSWTSLVSNPSSYLVSQVSSKTSSPARTV